MKLLTIKNRSECEAYPKAWLSFGKCYAGGTGAKDGFYIHIMSPFTKMSDYIDPIDYLTKNMRCRKVLLIRARKIRGCGPLRVMKFLMFVPASLA